MIRIDISGLTVEQIQRKFGSTIINGLEIMRYACQGLADAEIAPLVYLSLSAVKCRLKALYPVIGARNRAHAVAICVAQGWLTFADTKEALKTRRFRSINVATNRYDPDAVAADAAQSKG